MTKQRHSKKSVGFGKDPYASREAQKYEKPIASREFILDYLKKLGKPARFDRIAEDLHLTKPEDLVALTRRLTAMCRDGQLSLNRREGYGLIEKMNLITGRVQGHRDGFGFLIPDDNSDDLTLNARQMRKVFDGDRVVVRVAGIDHKGRREAAVVDVLEHNTQNVVGRYISEKGVHYVVPENRRITQHIIIAEDKTGQARHGQIVIVAIDAQPQENQLPTGHIAEVLGDHLAPGMEIDIAVRVHQLPHEWPEEVTRAVAKLRPEVAESAKKGRVDLRHLPLVTIDGEDAQDFDDAVYAEQVGKNYRLIVAIADVAHYVQPETALDQEAMRRGNSVYFPGKVIPMLPEILSNGLCSLRPKVDRLCMVCDMVIDLQGNIIKHEFYNGVMHSVARLTYTAVNRMLNENDKQLQQTHQVAWPSLKILHKLFETLLKARAKRGALDFDTVETQIIFSKDRKIERIVPRHRNDAHRLIEECMLAANVATADFLSKQKDLSVLYRIHNGPKADRLTNLRQFLGELGLALAGNQQPKPHDYLDLLQRVEDRPDAHLIQMMLLRSLSQAVYSPDNVGHFGLAYNTYTHFTSPIRRYPDLLVHRAVKSILSKKKQLKDYPYTEAQVLQLGEHSSLTERRADDATRDATLSLKCQFLKDKVGQTFDGIISHVAGFGLFIELQDIYVEGLAHVTTLQNDYYIFDAAHQRLRGERTGKIYRIGDKVRVLVARVDVEQKQIDFELLPEFDQPRVKEKAKDKNKKYNQKKAANKAPSSHAEKHEGAERSNKSKKQGAVSNGKMAANTKPAKPQQQKNKKPKKIAEQKQQRTKPRAR